MDEVGQHCTLTGALLIDWRDLFTGYKCCELPRRVQTDATPRTGHYSDLSVVRIMRGLSGVGELMVCNELPNQPHTLAITI
jgi:hypothetical protein